MLRSPVMYSAPAVARLQQEDSTYGVCQKSRQIRATNGFKSPMS